MAYLNDIKITTFNTADSPATWTKDVRAKWIKIFMWGGGGGGGSGRQGLTTLAGGGGGGGTSGFLFWEGLASAFGTTETAVIGAGGAGGAAQAGASSDGNPGGTATASTFGNLTTDYTAALPLIANGGTATNASGSNSVSAFGVWSATFLGSSGGQGSNTTGTVGSTVEITTPLVNFIPTAGGGGSGADAVVIRQAGAGGKILKLDNSTTLVAGGAGGIESGTINGANGNVPLTSGGIFTAGTGGGGGGGQSSGGSAGHGGNGAVPGGGGGGGGGSLNGTASGAGGNGGNGRIIVIEFL